MKLEYAEKGYAACCIINERRGLVRLKIGTFNETNEEPRNEDNLCVERRKMY
jgi:hypothetical protein